MRCPSFFVFSLAFLPLALGFPSAPAGAAELAQAVNSGPMKVNVETQCVEGRPYFRIINEGEDWPRLAELEIVRIDDQSIIVKRSMRMKSGQNASFKLPVGKLGQGEYGLRLNPSWYERDVDYDARIACK